VTQNNENLLPTWLLSRGSIIVPYIELDAIARRTPLEIVLEVTFLVHQREHRKFDSITPTARITETGFVTVDAISVLEIVRIVVLEMRDTAEYLDGYTDG